MVVIVLPMSSHDHQLLCHPEIVTRGEKGGGVRCAARAGCRIRRGGPCRRRQGGGVAKPALRGGGSTSKHTKRSPMIIPMVTRL